MAECVAIVENVSHRLVTAGVFLLLLLVSCMDLGLAVSDDCGVYVR